MDTRALAQLYANSPQKEKVQQVREEILFEIGQEWNIPVFGESSFRLEHNLYADWRTYMYLGYLKKQDGTEIHVVVKEINRSTASRVIDVPARVEKVLKYFRRECGVSRRVGSHENIAEIFGIMKDFRSSIFPAIVMPFYSRRDLRYLVEHEPTMLTTTRAKLKKMYGVAKGLHFLHSCSLPVAHRDIKGSNILVKDVGERLVACIADFGSAKFLFDKKYDIQSTTKVTTWNWSVPERLNAQDDNDPPDSKKTCAADMWSFACTFLEVLTVRDPWESELSLDELLMGNHPERPSDIIIEESYWSIMKRCWNKWPEQRATAEDIVVFMGMMKLDVP